MTNTVYDSVIIGAGPAGMMAALAGYTPGRHIVLLEKMELPGRKLRITGKGRCNLTNDAALKDFLSHFGKKGGRFLRQAINTFSNIDLMAWFEDAGVPCIVERGGRVFPKSQQAQEIVDALVKKIKSFSIDIINRAEVRSIEKENNEFRIEYQRASKPPETVRTRQAVIAMGGKSYPRTGSTGDGYALAESLGHTIVPLKPALIPLVTEGPAAGRLQGVSLRNVSAQLWGEGRKIAEEFGEMVFTENGMSGPVILTLSRQAVPLIDDGAGIEIVIDLKPALDHKKVDARLLREIDENPRKHFRFLLKQLLPGKMTEVCAELLGIDMDKPMNQINQQERKALRLFLKEFRFNVIGYKDIEHAIVTAGGIALKEIDPRTMQSKLVPGLYFAGEIIDIDADTGGYNLQAAFSTGYLAGKSILAGGGQDGV